MNWTKFFDFLKKAKGWIFAIVIILIVIVPYVVLYFYLRKNGKEIIIHPKFDIVDIKNEKEINTNVAEDAVSKGKDILKRMGALD